jgi:hypothetical protein
VCLSQPTIRVKLLIQISAISRQYMYSGCGTAKCIAIGDIMLGQLLSCHHCNALWA